MKKQWISWEKKLSLFPKILIVSVLLQSKLAHFSGGGVGKQWQTHHRGAIASAKKF